MKWQCASFRVPNQRRAATKSTLNPKQVVWHRNTLPVEQGKTTDSDSSMAPVAQQDGLTVALLAAADRPAAPSLTPAARAASAASRLAGLVSALAEYADPEDGVGGEDGVDVKKKGADVAPPQPSAAALLPQVVADVAVTDLIAARAKGVSITVSVRIERRVVAALVRGAAACSLVVDEDGGGTSRWHPGSLGGRLRAV